VSLPWTSTQPYAEIEVGGDLVVLFHYAMRVWNRSHRGAWHLFGHSHGQLQPEGRSCDVGVDCWDFKPVSLEKIIASRSGSEA
jgi:calcineurin-like phosphoesterase family protein